MAKGIIHLSVSIYLEQDLDEDQINDLITNIDYTFNHPLIAETRINGQVNEG